MSSRRSPLRCLIPLLVRPAVQGARNRYFPNNHLNTRELLSSLITLAMMFGVYFCTSQMLRELSEAFSGHAIPIAPIASALLSGLFLIALLSASVTALSSLYASADLDFLLASPLPLQSLLFGKTCEVTFATSWMLLVFGAPLYLTFGIYFHAGAIYYLLAPLIGLTFIIPAILIGELGAILFAAMIPAYYGKWLFAGLFLVVLAGFFATMNSPLSIQLTGTEASDSLWSQANLLTHYQSVPARWAGTSIEALLLGHLGPTTPTLVTGILITGLLWAILAFVFARLFGHTVSVLQSRHAPWQFESRRTGIISHLFLASTNQSRRALITKEFFAFSRDATHTVQLIMLLTVCILYLYNFSRIEPPTRVGPDVLRVWDIFLILSNLILGSIVLLSICSRFVYPSISLEGNALWILQSAPISMRHIVRAKYFGWLIPTSVIAGVIFTSGGFALGLEPALVLTTTAAGVIICHGLVALGLGMGARFARFDWQHSAQITTNSGNLLYMLIGMILIGINTLPLTFIFGAYVLMPAIFHDDTATFILLCSGIGVLFIINFLAGYIALRFGTQALSTRHED